MHLQLEDTDIGFFYFLNNKTLSSEKIYTGRIAQKLPTESGHCVNLVGKFLDGKL
jgi:hypothetical protein